MMKLCNFDEKDPDGFTYQVATDEELRKFILSQLATTFSDDIDYLRKVNKLTFGLQSNQ